MQNFNKNSIKILAQVSLIVTLIFISMYASAEESSRSGEAKINIVYAPHKYGTDLNINLENTGKASLGAMTIKVICDDKVIGSDPVSIDASKARAFNYDVLKETKLVEVILSRGGLEMKFSKQVSGNMRYETATTVHFTEAFLSGKGDVYSHLFDIDSKYKQYLTTGEVDERLKKIFKDNNITLSDNAIITRIDDKTWRIIDGDKSYIVSETDEGLKIYTTKEVYSHLFDLNPDDKSHIKPGIVDKELKKIFLDNGITLSDNAKITKIDDSTWEITDGDNSYIIKETDEGIKIYSRDEVYDYLFSMSPDNKKYLKTGAVDENLRKIFEQNGIHLSDDAKITKIDDTKWKITDATGLYIIEETDDGLKIYAYGDIYNFEMGPVDTGMGAVIIEKGDKVVVKLNLKNTGTKEIVVNLDAESELKLNFPEKILVKAGETKKAGIEVFSGDTPGNYNVRVIGKAKQLTKEFTIPITIDEGENIPENPLLKIIEVIHDDSVVLKETSKVIVRVKNTGREDRINVKLQVPDDWEVQPTEVNETVGYNEVKDVVFYAVPKTIGTGKIIVNTNIGNREFEINSDRSPFESALLVASILLSLLILLLSHRILYKFNDYTKAVIILLIILYVTCTLSFMQYLWVFGVIVSGCVLIYDYYRRKRAQEKRGLESVNVNYKLRR